jgi:membrane protease YdiL (CAAX protease family)
MEVIGILIFVGSLIVIANLVELQPTGSVSRRAFNWILLAANLPVLFFGLLLLLAPADIMAQVIEVDGSTVNVESFGSWLVAMALWGGFAALPSFRRMLSRFGKALDPASSVHATALMLAGYLVGNTLAALSQGGLEGLAVAATEASIWDVLASQSLFAVVALLGIGMVLRRGFKEAVQRLGLKRPTARQLLMGTGAIVLLVIAQALVGYLWSLADPDQAALVEEISGSLIGDLDTVWEWLLLAIATGIGEELLFRGALQPVFGLGATSLVFALSHVQYGLTPLTVLVFVLALVLGYIRRRTNTTVCIFVHAGYNFTLGMLLLLANYAQTLMP